MLAGYEDESRMFMLVEPEYFASNMPYSLNNLLPNIPTQKVTLFSLHLIVLSLVLLLTLSSFARPKPRSRAMLEC